jgi:hypothetical protein
MRHERILHGELLPPQPAAMGGVPLLWRDGPFDGRLHSVIARDGTTIYEMVNAVADDLPQGFETRGIAIVSMVDRLGCLIREEEVPRSCWHLVRPRVREGFDITVRLAVRLRGSSNASSKSILHLVATIAVIAVASLFSFGVLGGVDPAAVIRCDCGADRADGGVRRGAHRGIAVRQCDRAGRADPKDLRHPQDLAAVRLPAAG